MPLYNKPSKDLVFDLIAQANPDLPLTLNSGQVSVGTPVVIPTTVPTQPNTSLKLVPRAPSGFLKSTTVQYRRLDFDLLFRAITLEIRQHTNAIQNWNWALKFSDLLPAFNKKYGMALTMDDVVDVNFSYASDNFYPGVWTNRAIIRAAPGSLAFVGQFTLRWVQAPPDLAALIKNTTLDGRVFPGGNDFSVPSNHAYVPNMVTYGIDFSGASPSIPSNTAFSLNTEYTLGNYGTHIALINSINSVLTPVTGHVLDMNPANVGKPWNVLGATIAVRTLPNASKAQEANAKQFNHVVTIDINNAWAVGRFYFHYNT